MNERLLHGLSHHRAEQSDAARSLYVIEPADPSGILLFGPGAGGSPARYQRLLNAASGSGFMVVAPIHERFDGRSVTDDQMRDRAIGLKAALDQVDRPELPVVAAGHSAGGWAALCLAGGQPRGRDQRPIEVPMDLRISRLVLLAPTLGWFQGPGALDNVKTPVIAMVGTADRVTNPNADWSGLRPMLGWTETTMLPARCSRLTGSCQSADRGRPSRAGWRDAHDADLRSPDPVRIRRRAAPPEEQVAP